MSRPSCALGKEPGQNDPRGGAEVERVDDPRGRDAHQQVAVLARQAAQPLVLLAEDQRGPAGEIHAVEVRGGRIPGGANERGARQRSGRAFVLTTGCGPIYTQSSLWTERVKE